MADRVPSNRWRRWLLPLGVAFAAAVTVYSPALLLNAVALLQHYKVVTDIAYASGDRRKLDVYRPPQAANAPVIVFFYGGSWQTGSKGIFRFVVSTLAARGYVVVVPDYRVYPDVKYPEFVEDGALAMRWTRDNIAAHAGDPGAVYVMGHSAGAYIAAMLALDTRWLKPVGLDPRRDIAGLIGVSGPYNFLPLEDETLKIIFGGDNQIKTQPITYVEDAAPPALLMTGETDNIVWPRNTRTLAAKLRAHGNAVTEIIYRRAGHISILGAFAPFIATYFPLIDEIQAFTARTRTATKMAAVDRPQAVSP